MKKQKSLSKTNAKNKLKTKSNTPVKKTKKVKKTKINKRSLSSQRQPSKLASLAKDIWPAERDILFRPDRYKYVRKIIQPQNCVFCEAAEHQPKFETLCLYQSPHAMIILNKFPYNSGHVLVLPKQHGGQLLDLKPEVYHDLHQTLRLAFLAVSTAYEPAGINMGMNHGAVAGAGIPDHLHYHLVPRWSGDLNFFPLIAETKTVIESLETTYERLQEIIKKHI